MRSSTSPRWRAILPAALAARSASSVRPSWSSISASVS
jgi:hypothetical protein